MEGNRLLITGISKALWLKECEMKLKVYRLVYRITEVSNQCVKRLWMWEKFTQPRIL